MSGFMEHALKSVDFRRRDGVLRHSPTDGKDVGLVVFIMNCMVDSVVQTLLIAGRKVSDDMSCRGQRRENFNIHGDFRCTLSGEEGVTLCSSGSERNSAGKRIQQMVDCSTVRRLVVAGADLGHSNFGRFYMKAPAECFDVIRIKAAPEFDQADRLTGCIQVRGKAVGPGQVMQLR